MEKESFTEDTVQEGGPAAADRAAESGCRRLVVTEWDSGKLAGGEARLPVERDVELWVDGSHLVTLFCTPQWLEELCTGFLLGQGFVATASQIAGVSADAPWGRVDVQLNEPLDLESRPARRSVIYSGCGQGPLPAPPLEKAYETAAHPASGAARSDPASPAAGAISGRELREALSKTLRRGDIYRATRGIHSAAVCTAHGGLLVLREDVGRHNALDKALGWAARSNLEPERVFVAASGRISSEAVDKLVRFGIAIMVAKGVPTSLAAEKAERAGITLAGSLGPNRLRIYTHPERVAP